MFCLSRSQGHWGKACQATALCEARVFDPVNNTYFEDKISLQMGLFAGSLAPKETNKNGQKSI